MKKLFLFISIYLFSASISLAEYKLEPTNCTKKKKENCGAYLYNTKTGSTYFCTSEKCNEILEALEDYTDQEVKGNTGKKESKKSKIPKFGKKKKKKSKIPKFKKKTN